MIKLYGISMSNYTNMVKTALLEKGLEFEQVDTMPGDESLLAKSPMGKVPAIEVDGKFICETPVILDYLDDIQPDPPLYPSDAMEKAKVKELMRVVELYVELALRRHYGSVFFGGEQNEAAVAEVKPVVEKGLSALNQLASFGPYLTGSQYTAADIYTYNSFGYGNMVSQAIYGWDIMEAVPGLQEAFAAIGARDAVKQVDAAQAQALAEFQAQQQAAG